MDHPRFKSCERIYIIDLSLFLKIKSLDMFVCLSVSNCSLVENVLDTFCISPVWYDLSVVRAHTNFALSKIYEGYFQLIYNLVH